MRAFHYCPILKGKAGETRALRWLRGRVRPNLIPVWELVPKPQQGPIEPIKDALNLADAWGGGQRILVDHGHILARGGLIETIQHARWFFESCSGKTRAIPVLRSKNPAELNEVLLASVNAVDGFAIRIAAEDVLRDASNALGFLERVLCDGRVSASAIDLIVDFGALEAEPSELQLAEAAYRLGRLPVIREWRTFVVAAGAFPENLTKFRPGAIERTPRADWRLWQQLVATGMLPRAPDFGDYAVHHPDLPPPIKGAIRASPSLRYTADSYWLVVRGKREKGQPPRPSQFRDRCVQLVEQQEFAGQFLCEGDEAIARCAAGSVINGDQSFWRAVATDHHITLVWDRLADIAGSQAA